MPLKSVLQQNRKRDKESLVVALEKFQSVEIKKRTSAENKRQLREIARKNMRKEISLYRLSRKGKTSIYIPVSM